MDQVRGGGVAIRAQNDCKEEGQPAEAASYSAEICFARQAVFNSGYESRRFIPAIVSRYHKFDLPPRLAASLGSATKAPD